MNADVIDRAMSRAETCDTLARDLATIAERLERLYGTKQHANIDAIWAARRDAHQSAETIRKQAEAMPGYAEWAEKLMADVDSGM